MLETVFGSLPRPEVSVLVDTLGSVPVSGTCYIGYPLLKVGDEPVTSDALLMSPEHGVVLFDLPSVRADDETLDSWLERIESHQDDLYRALYNKFLPNRELSQGRQLAFNINVISFVPDLGPVPPISEGLFADPNSLAQLITTFPPIEQPLFDRISAAVQRTRSMKPQNKRANVKRTDSYGAILKQIEAEIANLDAWQKHGAIEYPEGPQRLRGLAGSGKTIVLALKAALLHAEHPNWKIAVTFQTRSLHQQLKDLIRRFHFETVDDEPDWNQLSISSAWGSRNDRGLYYDIANAVGAEAKDFKTAQNQFGNNAFEGVCAELNAHIKQLAAPVELYDLVLIDEAQDFPSAFFRLVYDVVSEEKRIVWAYDELQNLGKYEMAPPAELFGYDSHGRPLVELRSEKGRPEQDIVLPRCYRNTPWALALAHALGFGIYRPEGLVQMFDNSTLWTDVGYEVRAGELRPGQNVVLKRKPNAAPAYFDRLLKSDSTINWKAFDEEDAQAEWIAEEIRVMLETEELEPKDFLIVLPEARTAQSKSTKLRKALYRRGIVAHLAGVTSSRDILFVDNSIAITQIYRAKGNEAAVVFIANAEYCHSGPELRRKRNTLFTAITRSRAWVRICGIGPGMTALIKEIEAVRDNNFQLDFRYPTLEEIQNLDRIHRDLDEKTRVRLDQELSAIRSVFEQIDAGELSVDSLPSDLKELLRRNINIHPQRPKDSGP